MHRKQYLLTSLRIRTPVLYTVALAMVLFLTACAGGQVKKKKAVYRIGVNMAALAPAFAQDLGLPEGLEGMVIVAVSQGSPAATAGIRSGDVITGIKMPDGKLQNTPDTTAFTELLKRVPTDQPVVISILRDGKTMELSSMRSTAQFSGYVQPEARSEPRTIKMAPDGSGDCRTLDGAMLLARPGDTVLIAYPGKGMTYGSFQIIRDNLTVRSEDPANRAVVGQILVFGLSGVKLTDLKFQAPQVIWPGVQILGSKDVTVKNCVFSGYVKAVTISGSRGVSITGNRMEKDSLGILAASGSEFRINGNLITGTGARGNDTQGIYISGSNGTVSNNTILYHKAAGTKEFIRSLSAYGGLGIGILVGPGSNVSIENNIVYDNSAGIFVAAGETTRYRVEYNDIFQNTVPTGNTGPWGIFSSMDFADYLTGSDWNFSRGVKMRNESAPILSLSSWNHTYYAPNPIPISRTNLSQDPFFNDPTQDDYRLAADSPLVGRGRGGTYIGAFPPIEQKAGTGEFK